MLNAISVNKNSGSESEQQYDANKRIRRKKRGVQFTQVVRLDQVVLIQQQQPGGGYSSERNVTQVR